MEMLLVLFWFAVGIVFIVKGGDFFVDAASWMARVSGIPQLIIGATVVSLATTLPEMLVSVMAAVQGKVDMSIGNAVGSVTANIGLIMAISIICMPQIIKKTEYLFKTLCMFAAMAVIIIGGFLGAISMPLSIVLLVFFGAFMYENVSSAVKTMKLSGDAEEEKLKPSGKEIAVNIVKFAVGTAGIVIGADLLVDNGSILARMVGISERVIGVTVIAIGTSLPELVTTLTAIIKKQPSLSVGNIIGANVLDLTLIMPIAAVISGKALPVAQSSAMIDLPASLLVGLIAMVPALLMGKFKRWQGYLLLGVYLVYVAITCFVMA